MSPGALRGSGLSPGTLSHGRSGSGSELGGGVPRAPTEVQGE